MTAITLKQLKAKFTRLHHLEKQWIFLDNDEHDMIEAEEPFLYHIIRARKRQDPRIDRRTTAAVTAYPTYAFPAPTYRTYGSHAAAYPTAAAETRCSAAAAIVLQLQGQEKQLQQKRQKVLQGTLWLQEMKQVEWCSLQVSFGSGAWKFGVYTLKVASQ